MWGLAVSQGSLIVAGYFNAVGDWIEASSIARWDGSEWHPLGSGIGTGELYHYQYVFDVEVRGEHIFAGGNFMLAGGQEAKRIACWDGTSWTPLGIGMGSAVYALSTWDDELYAGGAFSRAGIRASRHIGRWIEASASVPDDPAQVAHWLSVPNPFRIGYQMQLTPAGARQVEVIVFDITGRSIRNLYSGVAHGQLQLTWDGRTDAGVAVPSGVYGVRATLDRTIAQQRFTFVR